MREGRPGFQWFRMTLKLTSGRHANAVHVSPSGGCIGAAICTQKATLSAHVISSQQQHHDAVSSQLHCSSLQGTIKATSRTCELGLLLGLLLGAELLALMPAGGGGSSPPAGAGTGGSSPVLAEPLVAEAGIGGARKPAPPALLLLLGLRAAMDDIKPPPVPLEAIGLTLMVSPAFKLKSC